MNCHEFFKIPCGVLQVNFTASKPKLEDIKSDKFDRGSERMFWKTSHLQEEFYSSQFFQRKLIKSLGNNFQRIEKLPNVNNSKIEDIVTILCPLNRFLSSYLDLIHIVFQLTVYLKF